MNTVQIKAIKKTKRKKVTIRIKRERLKDSCDYSIGLAEQFINLSSGGIAFTSGILLFPDKNSIIILDSCSTKISMIFFGICIALGLLFVMKIVGNINKKGNYNVYGKPQLISFIQLVSFLTAIVFLIISVF